MGVKTIETRVCDVCGREDNPDDARTSVTTYKVTYPKKWTWTFDLCPKDGKALEDLREHAKTQGTAVREREVSTVASVTESRKRG